MAKKVTGYIKLQIPAGKATPAPPVGPALGQHGVNIVQFTKEFNARTANQEGMIIPVVITVYQDRSFSFITKTPPAAVLLKKACTVSPTSKSTATSSSFWIPMFLISVSLNGTGFEPGPTNPVTPLVLRTTYHVSSFMIMFNST